MADPIPNGPGAQAPAPETLENLFTAHEASLLVYARRFVESDEAAQDVVQEAFEKLHAGFDAVRKPRTWLYRTVHNLALNHRRGGKRLVSLETAGDGGMDVADPQALPDEHIERMEAIGQTRLCIEALDARSRELIRLKFEEELSYQDISRRTQLTVGHVGYLLHHALKRLGAELAKLGVVS
ncbi:MAG TPA: RNA polymerase sigma factor [Candidatus Paceibacterota bacterium]|mgnify:CR=1 FL=1|nr:RNA polymerase sigma factor [Verrucomicrobiota bacterium]HOX03641.1 RNA polymerase sigma factor [Verrucomicrobiota bacterium]HRZ46552.1 RNA polymerase sigma factor [Candidatus Paceibacterota bacterium]HRZ91367.1 RNA polymerase sigma factor [Candidatus Paceibacterota bacterium]